MPSTNQSTAKIAIVISIFAIAISITSFNTDYFRADLKNTTPGEDECNLVYRCSGTCTCRDGTVAQLESSLHCGEDALIPFNSPLLQPRMCNSVCAQHGGVDHDKRGSISCSLVLRECELVDSKAFDPVVTY